MLFGLCPSSFPCSLFILLMLGSMFFFLVEAPSLLVTWLRIEVKSTTLFLLSTTDFCCPYPHSSHLYIYMLISVAFAGSTVFFIPIYSRIWWSDMMHIIICIDRSALFHTHIPREKIWVKACGGGLREATAFRYYSEPLLVGDAAGAAVKILVDDHRGYSRLLYYQWIG